MSAELPGYGQVFMLPRHFNVFYYARQVSHLLSAKCNSLRVSILCTASKNRDKQRHAARVTVGNSDNLDQYIICNL